MMRWSIVAASLASLLLQAGVARANCKLGQLAELPVTMVGLRPLVPAEINGEHVSFLADSGAFFSNISPAAAAQLKLPHYGLPFGFRVSGIGGDADASLTTVRVFGLAKSSIKNVDFIVSGSEPGSGAVGLLGQNVLRLADAEFDFANGVIRLMRPEDCAHANFVYWTKDKPYTVVDIDHTDAHSPKIIGTVIINGARIRAAFDTGAASTILARSAARRAGMPVDGPNVRPAGYSSGIGRNLVRSWIARMASFQIGDEKILNTEIRIADFDLGEAEMLIGADFFLAHHVYVAYSQNKLYLTYNGGPVFNLIPAVEQRADGATVSSPDSAKEAEPADASGYARRGAAELTRGEREKALADLNRACELAPTEADYFYQRAQIRLALHEPVLAMADLDKALELKPDDVQARMWRATLRLSRRDTNAREDLDAVARSLPEQADQRFTLAEGYAALDQFEPAVREFDLWIRAHPDDSRMGAALNGRCWARALGGFELDRALSDCNVALRRFPNRNANVLDSRAMVELRRGDLDRAIADYDAVLAIQPKEAWSLYGRGLAKMRKGLKAEGEADLAAAEKIAPALPARAAKLGLSPTAADSSAAAQSATGRR